MILRSNFSMNLFDRVIFLKINRQNEISSIAQNQWYYSCTRLARTTIHSARNEEYCLFQLQSRMKQFQIHFVYFIIFDPKICLVHSLSIMFEFFKARVSAWKMDQSIIWDRSALILFKSQLIYRRSSRILAIWSKSV